MLDIVDLKVNYGVIPALRGITLHVQQGEIVALIGANGAGKTTTLKTISGLKAPSSGTITFLGQDLTKVAPYKMVSLGIAHAPEGRGIFSNLTVTENLRMGAYLLNDKQKIAEDMDAVFQIFPRLQERKKQIAGTLSGGELQMLAIARAIVMRPKLLLLDEPSMGLAPILVQEVFDKIKQLNEEQSVTVLLVEQNANMALAISHRAYVLETGEITMEGDAKKLLENDDVKKAYLGI